MEVIYRVNGKEFNTQEEASNYELELERKEQERIEKEQEKKKRLDEVCDAANKYINLKHEYEKDYGLIGRQITDNKTLKLTEYADIVNDLLKFFIKERVKLWQLDRHLVSLKQQED